ncbi:MAG: hypothetical protein AAGC56_07810 [Pseudomonadota bacterium]
MFEVIINDVVAILRATFLNGDWLSLAIAFGSVILAALVMQRGTQIGSMTLLALVFFVIGSFVRGLVAGAPAGDAVEGAQMVGQFERSWSQFMSLRASALLAYFLAFMLFVFLLFTLKSAVRR